MPPFPLGIRGSQVLEKGHPSIRGLRISPHSLFVTRRGSQPGCSGDGSGLIDPPMKGPDHVAWAAADNCCAKRPP